MARGDERAPDADTGSDMRAAYVRVLVIEVVVIAALVWFGWQFS